jgi:hypothetical protein
MKRMIKLLGIAMVLTAVLVVALAGSAFAKGPSEKAAQTQNQGVVQPCGDCVNDDCVPNLYNYDNEYLTPGPHGK